MYYVCHSEHGCYHSNSFISLSQTKWSTVHLQPLTENVQYGLVICNDDATPVFGQVFSTAQLPRDTQDFGYVLQQVRRIPKT
jgi:hypothetical protein